MSSDEVPVLDLTAWADADHAGRAELAAMVDRALQETGFLLVTGHDVASELTARARTLGKQFFDLPTAVKAQYAVEPGGRGWIGQGVEANGYAAGVETPPDLKESFAFGQTLDGDARGFADMYGSNSWPTQVPGFPEAIQEFADAALAVADALLEVFAVALGQPPRTFLDACLLAPYVVNVTRYPSLAETGDAAAGQFRIGPHTDFGTLTVLDRQRGRGGLQIQRRDGTWMDAPWVPGALTVNVGDLLERWTGDRWRSTAHRVLPPDPAAPDEELVSLVFFHEADPWTEVRTLPVEGARSYEPVIAGEWLRTKLRAITMAP